MTLSTAAKAGRRVWLRYQAADAQETERAFDPYGVSYYQGFWYTIGYCHLRQGQRLRRRVFRQRVVAPEVHAGLQLPGAATGYAMAKLHIRLLNEVAVDVRDAASFVGWCAFNAFGGA